MDETFEVECPRCSEHFKVEEDILCYTCPECGLIIG